MSTDAWIRRRSIAGVPVGLTRFGFERQKKRVRLSRPCNRTMPGAMLEMAPLRDALRKRGYNPDKLLPLGSQCAELTDLKKESQPAPRAWF